MFANTDIITSLLPTNKAIIDEHKFFCTLNNIPRENWIVVPFITRASWRQNVLLTNFPYLESRWGQSASISSIKITDGLPDLAWVNASAKASLKIFSLSPACALWTECGLQNIHKNIKSTAVHFTNSHTIIKSDETKIPDNY